MRRLGPIRRGWDRWLEADRLGRDVIMIELNPEYTAMIKARLTDDSPLFMEVLE